jgi:hypothetical protein
MADLPHGQFSDFPVQPPLQKYFLFSSDPNHILIRRRPVPHEGRLAIVTDAGRDAVDAGGADDEQHPGGRPSRVVLTPRRRRQALEKKASQG